MTRSVTGAVSDRLRSSRPSAREGASPARATVLVLWVGHRPGPWTCRSLARSGYRVVRAHPAGATGGWTPSGPPPLSYPSPTEDPEGFLGFVTETCRRERVSAVLPAAPEAYRLVNG